MDKERDRVFLMRRFHLILEKNINNLLEEYGLTFAQLHILMFLTYHCNDVSTFKKIEKRIELPQSSTVNLIQKLENKGLVETFCSDTDRRVKEVKVTDKGKEICVFTSDKATIEGNTMFGMLSEEEKEILFILIAKICNNQLK